MNNTGRIPQTLLVLSFVCMAGQTHAALIKIACVQMQLSNSLTTNTNATISHIASEAAQGTRVLVFPEFSLTGYNDTVAPTYQQPAIESAINQVAAACDTHNVYAIVGTPYFENNIRYNAAIVIGPDGAIVERYFKNHIVESFTTNGNRLAMFPIDGVLATIFICHDERYPELARIPATGGARILFYIAYEEETSAGKNFNYRCQIVGRAVENQSWVIACNAPAGNEASNSNGHSRIIGPDGTLYQEAGEPPTIIRHTIDTDLASNAWAQAGAATPLLGEFWEEGLRVLQTQNVDVFPSVTASPTLQPNIGILGGSPSADIKIACVQMQMGSDIAANAAKAVSFIDSEANQNTRVVVFPECALTDRNPATLPNVSQAAIDAGINQIAAACDTRNVYAIVGSPFRENGNLYNGAYVIDPNGAIIKRHAQMYTDLPGVFTDGSKMSLFKIDNVYTSVMVGHDIHYPELSRIAVLGGARLCIYLAYEPAGTSLYASESQVVCRSVESLMFTVFCNAGTGNAAGNSTGHSRIVSSTAQILAEGGTLGDTAVRAIVPTWQASTAYAQAGAATPSLVAYWQEGLDVLRLNNPDFYGDAVPPIIHEVTPDPTNARVNLEYVQQLTLSQGMVQTPTWSILNGPIGAQVDSNGRVSWTPSISNINNNYTFLVEATNLYGSDTETWQVQARSRGDQDEDHDVDQTDFGLFQKCMSGTGFNYAPGCGDADLDRDGDVDLADFNLFMTCMAGANNQPPN